MRVFLISLSNTYEQVASALQVLGHTVFLQDELNGAYSGEEWGKSKVLSTIEEFNPDVVINNMPALFLPPSSNYTYIGNTQESANLELQKWSARQKAQELGFNLPSVLEECTMNTVSTNHSNTIFLKPKGLDPWHQAWKIPASTNISEHNNSFPEDIPAFVEEDIQHDIEGGCIFTMKEGSYTIVKTQGYTSRGDEKILDGSANWKDGGIASLTLAQETLLLDACTTWLNYAATLGGTYEGEICTGIKGTDIYWFEQNSRRGTFATLTGSAQDWLDSLILNVSKASNISWDFNF